jgi:hypothetical protein
VKYFDPSNYFKFFSKVSVSMEGTPLFPGIYASVKHRSTYLHLLIGATTLDGFLGIIISILGYYAYGNNIREIIILNMSYGVISNLIQITYTFGVLCSFLL